MNFPWERAQVLGGRALSFVRKQCTFLGEMLKFPGEIYVLNLFAIMVISFFKNIVLQPIIGKF
jgi:hypothetical protein